MKLYRITYNRIKTTIDWLKLKLTKKQFILFSSVLVGLTAGLSAIALKLFVHFIFYVATYEKLSNFKYFYLFLPIIGIALTVLVVKKILNNNLERGLSQVHVSIAKRSSFMKRHKMYDQVITSSLTVGMGGSVGLEAPIVVTGAALGSNYAKTYKLNYKERTLILACGISAGIGAAFNAPIAGVLFALEVLLLDISISAFTPLIIAAATGALISKVILHENILLSFELKDVFNYFNVPFYILLGVLCGFVSVYHSRMFTHIEGLFHKRPGREYQKVMVGGILLATLIALFPSLFGEGYQSIKELASQEPVQIMSNSIVESLVKNEWVILLVIGLLVLLKSIATGLTLGAGGNGGNFAPSLFVGAYLGFFFSRLVNLLKINELPENNFTIVGMAGILSGLYHAPLTAIFLIAEITGGYTLMIPLMIVSSISFAISRYFEPFSMDTKKIAKSGDVFTQDRDRNLLNTIQTAEFIENDYPTLSQNDTLGKLAAIVANSKRNVFPVVDEEHNFYGIVILDDIREIMFKRDFYDKITVNELLIVPSDVVSSKQSMLEVMKKFDDSGTWFLPVVDAGVYVGFISKSNVFSGYRNRLKVTTIE